MITKLIISFLFSFAHVYEKVWMIEYAFEALQLAKFLGNNVLFDGTDDFQRYIIHIEHELDNKVRTKAKNSINTCDLSILKWWRNRWRWRRL